MQPTILSFGEALWDLLPGGPVLGGAPLNLAYRVHSLGNRALLVSRLGPDDLGRRARREIEALGLDPVHLQTDVALPTGTVQVELDPAGNPDFFIVPGVAYDRLELTPALETAAESVDCFCFGTLVQRAEVARRTLYQLLAAVGGRPRFLDLNLRKDCHSPDTIRASLGAATMLKLNDAEAGVLAAMFDLPTALPEFARTLLERWPLTHCVITLGHRGAFALAAAGAPVYVPGWQVEVVDTCGAGDAFSAGFLHGVLRGGSLAECCQLGNALGALVAMQPGATGVVPRARLEQFLRDTRLRASEPALAEFATA